MEKLSNIHIKELSADDFSHYPIWVWDDQQEGHHPLSLCGTRALPTEFGTLFIRASFTTGSGRKLHGYLIGIESFYGFALFVNGKAFLINLNLPDLAAPMLSAIARQLGGGNVLPLRYESDVQFEDRPIAGVFEKI